MAPLTSRVFRASLDHVGEPAVFRHADGGPTGVYLADPEAMLAHLESPRAACPQLAAELRRAMADAWPLEIAA